MESSNNQISLLSHSYCARPNDWSTPVEDEDNDLATDDEDIHLVCNPV